MSGLKSLRIGDGIRSRLIVLALIGAIPFIWYRISDIRAGEAENIASIREQAMHAAARGTEKQAEVFAEIRTLLSVISKVPAVTSGTSEDCATFLRSVKDTRYWAKTLFVTNPEGTIVCATDPAAIGLEVGDRAYFQNALATRNFAVSDFINSRLDGQPIIAAAFPNYGPDGKLKNMLEATMKLVLFDEAAADFGRELGAEVLIFDGTGKILAGYPEAKASDAAARATIGTRLDTNGVGWFDAKDDNGVRRLYGVAALPGTAARLATGFSIEAALAETTVKIRAAYLNAAAVGAAIILLAWLCGEVYFLRPLRSLIDTTRQLAGGNFNARAKVGHSASEFRELGSSFNMMADRLAMLATSDSLTGLANRRRFEQYLDDEWRRAQRSLAPLALAIVDIDGFKLVNDRHGHQTGDECLKLVASELARFARRSEDLLARFGGEEFIVGMPGMAESEAYRHCERMRAAIAALRFEELGLPAGAITISVGVAVFVPAPGSTADRVIAMADAALYEAKRAGRNRVALYRDGPVPSTIHVA